MKIVHFGTYSTSEGYPRNAVVAAALESAGAQIIPCHRDAWGDSAEREKGVASLFHAAKIILKLSASWISLTWEYLTKTPPHDLVVVGYPGQLDIFLARILAALRKKPVVLDAFLSVYEAVVEDRKLASPKSVKARLYKFLDWASASVADAVLMDTDEHIRYYRDVIGVEPDRFIRVFVGADEEYFAPPQNPPEENAGEILFFGSFLPLHGGDVIVRAAAILSKEKNIRFSMIGDGPEREHCEKIARESGADISWHSKRMDYRSLVDRIARSEICLGIFSDGAKASRVIPCKVFNALATRKPLITADTPATREALADGENALLVPPGDPAALAEAIMRLHNDAGLRKKIADGGYKLFAERFSRGAIGKDLLSEFQKRLGQRK